MRLSPLKPALVGAALLALLTPAGFAWAQDMPGPAPPPPAVAGPLTGGVGASEAGASGVGARMKLVPPPGGRIYHSAYPDFRDTEDFVTVNRVRRFERLAGKRIAWAYFSNNWGREIRFPVKAVRRIHAAGSVPFIRLMARKGWRESGPDPRYRLQRIIDGDFDSELIRWGQAAARWARPMLVEFGTEANGSWFPWNGAWNGGPRTTGFGDPAKADGPERFRAAYRRVRRMIEAGGADNLTWFFHADDESLPARPWNSLSAYYPGDRFVDWVGVSVYGPLTADESWTPGFARSMSRVYPRLTALSSKPIALLEFGSMQGRPKAAWFTEALGTVASGRFPRLKAISVWSEAWRNGDGSRSNLKINSDRRTLLAYRKFVRRPLFVPNLRFQPR
jgi:hypothetical protein